MVISQWAVVQFLVGLPVLGGCVSIDNDSRLGMPRTSTDETSVKFVADALEEDCHVTDEELSRAMGIPSTSVF